MTGQKCWAFIEGLNTSILLTELRNLINWWPEGTLHHHGLLLMQLAGQMLILRQGIDEAQDLSLTSLGASYLRSVPWLHPPPITFASCHTPGRALCHTEAQKGDCESISSDPWPLRRNKAEGMRSSERSIATIRWRTACIVADWTDGLLACCGSVWATPRLGWLQTAEPHLLNLDKSQSPDSRKCPTHRTQNGLGHSTATYPFQKPSFAKPT